MRIRLENGNVLSMLGDTTQPGFAVKSCENTWPECARSPDDALRSIASEVECRTSGRRSHQTVAQC